MTESIKILHYHEILDFLHKTDRRVVFEKTNVIPDDRDLYDSLNKYVCYEDIGCKSVLGIDIFQYTSYGEFEQTLLPFLFKLLFKTAIKVCLENHPYLFQKYTQKSIENSFISTGDGGFLIFDTPLHSLVFASNFAVTLRVFNSYHYYPKLRKTLGEVNLRYAITYDKIYTFENNYYGRAMINNARILIKDNLNRCLIDENVYSWFTINIDGIENLQVLTIHDIANIHEFKHAYDTAILEQQHDEIFEDKPSRDYGIINSDILHVGKIKSKETEMNIYNLHLQIALKLYNDDDRTQTRFITASLGNLNTAGI